MESREAGAGEDRSKSQGERIVGGAIEMEEPGAKATPSLLLAQSEAVQFNYVWCPWNLPYGVPGICKAEP